VDILLLFINKYLKAFGSVLHICLFVCAKEYLTMTLGDSDVRGY